MNSINLQFDNPWIMLLLIPAVALALWPYLKIKKHRRRTRNRVVSMVLHIVILTLITSVFANFKVRMEDVLMKKDAILLVDVSDSTTVTKDKIDDYLEDILTTYDNPNKVGIVTFGNNSEYVAKLSSNAKSVYGTYKGYDVENKTDATNIEEALLYCQSILNKNGRVIILTDGLETDGDALSAASKLAAKKIQVDAVFFGNLPVEKEIQVNNLEVEGPVTLDRETNINVYLQSMSTGIAKLKLYDTYEGTRTQIGEQELFVHSNETIVQFKYQFLDEGDHVLDVVLETSDGDDTYVENNKYYSFVNITLDTKLLLVDGTNYESNNLYNLLSAEFDVTRVNAPNVSNELQELKQYSEIILMNVSAGTLPANFDFVLEQYIALGGNVLTTGGTNTYYFGEMEGTLFEDFLPVNVIKEDETPITVMLVVDASSSMNGDLAGSFQSRMEIAKAAAVQSVQALRDCDYVGVIAFDESAELVVPITPATQRNSIIAKINQIQSGVGTHYVPALTIANNELISYNDTEIKHIIFASDGEPQDNGYKQYIAAMFEKGITTTTIGIGTNAAVLQEIAAIGGGNFHTVTSGFDLARIMVEEIENLQSSYLNEEELGMTPRIKQHTAVVRGISSVPAVKGYIGVTAKDDATVVLTVNGDPLYAEWTYGEGKVASFMSDLGRTWTSNYFSDERGKKFVLNVVNNLLANTEIQSEFAVEFDRQNFTNVIRVKTESDNGKNKVEAVIQYPNGDIKAISLKMTANNEYAVQLPDYGKEGLYKVILNKTTSKGTISDTFFTTFSYSMEYNAFNDYEESYKYIEKLTKNGKGKIYSLDDNVFAHDIIYDDLTYNPQLGLVILALILFLLDIAVRKFNWKWPHEIWGKKKKTEEALI